MQKQIDGPKIGTHFVQIQTCSHELDELQEVYMPKST